MNHEINIKISYPIMDTSISCYYTIDIKANSDEEACDKINEIAKKIEKFIETFQDN